MARPSLFSLWNFSSRRPDQTKVKAAGRSPSTPRSRRLGFENLEGRELFAVVFDSNFENGGKVLTPFSTSIQSVTGMAVQRDRKIVVVGNSTASMGRIVMARYEADGNLDVTFGNNGLVTSPVGMQTDYAADVAVQSDGKIVVVGNLANDMLVARFDRNGKLDPAFNGTGIVVTPFGSLSSSASSVAIQSNGKIVVGGVSSRMITVQDFTAVRYNTDGSLDTTFSGDGKATTLVGTLNSIAKKVLVQADGKVILAGDYFVSGHNEYAAVRFTAAGALDPTFSRDGIFTVGVGALGDVCSSAALQTDGKLLLVGGSNVGPGNGEVSVVRLKTNGGLDPTFSTDGKVTAGYSTGGDNGLDVVQRSDGKILVGGTSVIASSQYAALFQFTAAGVLDKSFDADGRRSISQFATTGFTQVLALPSGSILATGLGSFSGINVFALARFVETKPVISSFVVPTRAVLNQRVHLSGLAHDPNQSSATLKYTWTVVGPRGFKVTLVGKNANFVAAVKGKLTVTLLCWTKKD